MAGTEVTFDTFEEAVRADPELLGVTQGMAEELPQDSNDRFVGIEAAFLGLVLIALYRLVQGMLDRNRGQFETQIAERRVELIKELMEKDGVTLEQASTTVDTLLKQVIDGRVTDNHLEKLLGFFGK